MFGNFHPPRRVALRRSRCFDVNDAIRNACSAATPQARANDLRLALDLSVGRARGDRTVCTVVLSELLRLAFQESGDGRIVFVASRRTMRRTLIRVSYPVVSGHRRSWMQRTLACQLAVRRMGGVLLFVRSAGHMDATLWLDRDDGMSRAQALPMARVGKRRGAQPEPSVTPRRHAETRRAA